jgi:hypothetical protein
MEDSRWREVTPRLAPAWTHLLRGEPQEKAAYGLPATSTSSSELYAPAATVSGDGYQARRQRDGCGSVRECGGTTVGMELCSLIHGRQREKERQRTRMSKMERGEDAGFSK